MQPPLQKFSSSSGFIDIELLCVYIRIRDQYLEAVTAQGKQDNEDKISEDDAVTSTEERASREYQ